MPSARAVERRPAQQARRLRFGLAAVFALIVREARYRHVLAAAGVPDTPARRAYAARLTSLGLRALARQIQARPSRTGAALLP